MARRGGRRGRRSRSKQRSKGAGSRSSKAKSSKSRSRNTRGSGARKSAPSKRRNTRSTTKSRASNRRSTASKKRQATRSAPKRSAPKKTATKRRTPTKNRRGSGISSKRKNIGTKIGTTVKNTAKKVTNTAKNVASKVKKTVGRVTRPPSARAKNVTSTRQAAFNKQLKTVQATNKPLGNPNVMSADGTFNRPGAGPANDPDYKTAYAPNVGLTNKLRTNPITNLARDAAYGLGFNTPRLMAQSAEAQQDMRDQRSQFHVGNKPRPTRPRKMGGSKRPLAVHTDIRTPPPEEIIEETQPITGDMSGTDPNDLTRIQNQAYSTALSNNMAGLAGDFDFGPQSAGMAIGQVAQGVLQAGQSRGRRRIRRFNRGRRRGAGDSFRRGGRRIQEFTSTQLNI